MIVYWILFGVGLFVVLTCLIVWLERRRERKKIIEDRLFARSMWDKGL